MEGTEEGAVRSVASIIDQEDSEESMLLIRNAFRYNNRGYDQAAIQSVINEYFEDNSGFAGRYGRWTEDAFSANRDGSKPDQYSYSRAFDVQGADQTAPGDSTGPASNGCAAPSRPPSRAQNRSPMGKLADWATKDINGTALASFTLNRFQNVPAQREDEDFQKAIEASLQTTGPGVAPQESGIVAPTSHTNQTHFGPANRANYDEKNWAIVVSRKKSFDSPPSRRKRNGQMPVYLVCRLEQDKRHRLGPLLMILHEISAARNFFLLLEGTSWSYDNHKDWWKGEQILAKGQPPSAGQWGHPYQDVNLVDELQRLIAFLDLTDRSYGTADSLCENQLIKSAWGDPILRFYESLYNCSNSHELPRMWTTVTIDNTLGESRPQEFAILDFRIPEDAPDVLRNLYSQWDYLFWIHQENGWQDWEALQDKMPSQIASIQTPAQIMTMRIQVDGTGQAIEVPEILYIDRYLESNVESARSMQHTMFRTWKVHDVVKEKELKVLQWKNPETGQVFRKIDIAKKAIQKSEDEIWRIRANALWRMHEESIGTDDQIPYLPDEMNHLAQLNANEERAVKHFEAKIGLIKAMLAKIDRKLARLTIEKEACCALFKELNKTFTVPNQDPKLNPTHKYSLRGVITSPDVLYMCIRRRQEVGNNDNGCDGPEFDQWYRVSWSADGANAVQQTETTFEKVEEAMFKEVDANGSRAPILVYATEEAITEQHDQISSTLQSFVKRDNRFFGQELKEEPPSSPRDKKRVAARSPHSPPKRQRSDSADSMASNRASIGDFSDGEDRAALLAGQFDDVFGPDLMGDTEMADMRPISHDEIAAHLAPPTPALSADDASDQDSPGLRRSSEKLASFSLNDAEINVQQEMGKTPEMEEQLKTPFIVRRPASSLDNRASIMERPMEIDANLEIPGVNPEEYYHQGS